MGSLASVQFGGSATGGRLLLPPPVAEAEPGGSGGGGGAPSAPALGSPNTTRSASSSGCAIHRSSCSMKLSASAALISWLGTQIIVCAAPVHRLADLPDALRPSSVHTTCGGRWPIRGWTTHRRGTQHIESVGGGSSLVVAMQPSATNSEDGGTARHR